MRFYGSIQQQSPLGFWKGPKIIFENYLRPHAVNKFKFVHSIDLKIKRVFVGAFPLPPRDPDVKIPSSYSYI